MIKSIDRDKHSEFIDSVFEFKGLWGMPSLCGLKITHNNNRTIVIATEMYAENPGTSVTSWCENLASQICTDNDIPHERLLFVVHTPDTHSKLSFLNESFFIVHFDMNENQFSNPRWEEISRDKLREICS